MAKYFETVDNGLIFWPKVKKRRYRVNNSKALFVFDLNETITDNTCEIKLK